MSAAMISTALLDWLNLYFDAKSDPKIYGYILAVFMLISYLGSALAFFIAGIHYKRYMEGKTEDDDSKK